MSSERQFGAQHKNISTQHKKTKHNNHLDRQSKPQLLKQCSEMNEWTGSSTSTLYLGIAPMLKSQLLLIVTIFLPLVNRIITITNNSLCTQLYY